MKLFAIIRGYKARIHERLASKLAESILKSYIYRKLKDNVLGNVQTMVDGKEHKIMESLKAFQAIDHNYHSFGHIILCLTVNNQDYVQIINVPKNLDLKTYRGLVASIESQCGLKVDFFDSPTGMKPIEFLSKF